MNKFLSIFVMAIVLQALVPAFAQQLPATGTTAENKTATKLGKYLTAAEAVELRKTNKSAILLDVRPVASYYYSGHPFSTHNIPLNVWTGRWDPEKKSYIFLRNTKFEERVAAKFADKNATILVLSKSGIVGARAVDRLADTGYVNVFNITDGFDGWQKAGLAVTQRLDPKLVYILEPDK